MYDFKMVSYGWRFTVTSPHVSPSLHLEVIFLFYFFHFFTIVWAVDLLRARELKVLMVSLHQGGGGRLSMTDAEERDAFTPTFLPRDLLGFVVVAADVLLFDNAEAATHEQ